MDIKDLTLEELARQRPDLVAAAAVPKPSDLMVEFARGPRKGERFLMSPASAAKFGKAVRVLPDDQQPKPSGQVRRVAIKPAADTAGAGARGRA